MKAYIIGAVVGGIIGYITNWLAIKMLFRPHEEKSVFGIKIPFTPGLIPKEKSRIAKSVGETIGEHLLTSEIIVKSLNNPIIKNNIKSKINNKIDCLWDSKETIHNALFKMFGKSYLNEENKIKDKISKDILSYISKPNFIDTISEKVSNCIIDEIKFSPKVLIEFVKSNKMRTFIHNIINQLKDSDEFSYIIKNIVESKGQKILDENKRVSEIIPKKFMNVVEDLIYKEKDFISQELFKALTNEEISSKLKNIIENNIPSIVSMFVSADSIFSKITDILDGYLNDENNKENICKFIIYFIKNSEDIYIKDMVKGLSVEDSQEIVNMLVKFIEDNLLCDECANICIDKIEQYILDLDSYEQIVKVIDNNYESNIRNNIKKRLSIFVHSNETKNLVNNIIAENIALITNLNFSDICSNKNEIEKIVFELVERYYDDFINEDAERFIESMNIPAMVEEQINSFEVSYAEKIILGIANKELKAITWLGAVLGFILGILSPLLSKLYV